MLLCVLWKHLTFYPCCVLFTHCTNIVKNRSGNVIIQSQSNGERGNWTCGLMVRVSVARRLRPSWTKPIADLTCSHTSSVHRVMLSLYYTYTLRTSTQWLSWHTRQPPAVHIGRSNTRSSEPRQWSESRIGLTEEGTPSSHTLTSPPLLAPRGYVEVWSPRGTPQ